MLFFTSPRVRGEVDIRANARLSGEGDVEIPGVLLPLEDSASPAAGGMTVPQYGVV